MIIPEYPPHHIGGGGIVYKNLIYHLKTYNMDISVIWGYYKSRSLLNRVEKYKHDDVTFYKIPEIPYPMSNQYLRTAMPPNSFGLMAIPKIIMNEKPDIAHLHGYGLPLMNIAAFWCRHYKVPYVFTIHGYPKTPQKKLLFNILWRSYEKLIMQPTLDNAKIITCVSKWVAKDSRLSTFRSRDKVRVVYNGIDTKEFLEVLDKSGSDIRSILNLPRHSIILCSIGRIAKMKGFQLVIKALPQLLERYSSKNICYVIIGEDEGYKNELQKLATELGVQDNLIFTGFLNGNVRFGIIQKCDVFIVPSLWEPFGLTALEGLAMKKVVVTTGVGGLKEFLLNSKNVIFFNKRDINSLFDAISLVLDEEVKHIFDNCHLEKFDWKIIVKGYIKVYEEAMGK